MLVPDVTAKLIHWPLVKLALTILVPLTYNELVDDPPPLEDTILVPTNCASAPETPVSVITI